MQSLLLLLTLLLFLTGCASLVSPEIQAKTREINRQGVQLIREDKWQEAEKIFYQSLKINPRDGAARNNLGFCYQKKGEFSQAIKEYQKALKFSDDPVILRQAHLNLVNLYLDYKIKPELRQPDWPDEAVKHLEVLLRDEPNSAFLHLWLGFAYFQAVNPGGGFIELEKASELAQTKEDIWIHERIMNFYLQMHLPDKAKIEEKIIEELNAQS